MPALSVTNLSVTTKLRSPRRWAVAFLAWQLLSAPVLLPQVATAQGDSLTTIGMIQGTGAASALSEQDVTTWGIVTALTDDGFYLQDPVGDGDPSTSRRTALGMPPLKTH